MGQVVQEQLFVVPPQAGPLLRSRNKITFAPLRASTPAKHQKRDFWISGAPNLGGCEGGTEKKAAR